MQVWGRGTVGTLGLALPSLPWRGPQLSLPFLLGLEDKEKRGRALACRSLSLSLAIFTPT